MEIPGFERCTSVDQLGIGVGVIYDGQQGLVQWNEAYRSDFYTGLHPIAANEPFKVVFENGDILYPILAVNNGNLFFVETLPYKVGSRVFWTADGETLAAEIAKDESGFYIESDERGACTNRWSNLPDLGKYISTVIKR